MGNGIRLLDLKREILDRKKISGSLDFDLKIVDESGRGENRVTADVCILSMISYFCSLFLKCFFPFLRATAVNKIFKMTVDSFLIY